jgi:hypothetical protein
MEGSHAQQRDVSMEGSHQDQSSAGAESLVDGVQGRSSEKAAGLGPTKSHAQEHADQELSSKPHDYEAIAQCNATQLESAAHDHTSGLGAGEVKGESCMQVDEQGAEAQSTCAKGESAGTDEQVPDGIASGQGKEGMTACNGVAEKGQEACSSTGECCKHEDASNAGNMASNDDNNAHAHSREDSAMAEKQTRHAEGEQTQASSAEDMEMDDMLQVHEAKERVETARRHREAANSAHGSTLHDGYAAIHASSSLGDGKSDVTSGHAAHCAEGIAAEAHDLMQNVVLDDYVSDATAVRLADGAPDHGGEQAMHHAGSAHDVHMSKSSSGCDARTWRGPDETAEAPEARAADSLNSDNCGYALFLAGESLPGSMSYDHDLLETSRD